MQSSIIKKILIPFAFALLAFATTSCKKDEICDHPSLPCQTHEGKNTFGCLIDGVPFVANVSFTIGGPIAVSGNYDEDSKLLQVQGKRDGANDALERVNFQSYISADQSSYEMYVQIEDYVGYTDYTGPKCQYFHDINNKGSVFITHIDLEKNIVAGTFSMTLINSACSPDSMVITEGRFDFGY